MNEQKLKENQIINVVLNDSNNTQLSYYDASLVIETATQSYVIDAIVQIPASQDENAETKPYHLIERIPFHSVLRIYTLDETK